MPALRSSSIRLTLLLVTAFAVTRAGFAQNGLLLDGNNPVWVTLEPTVFAPAGAIGVTGLMGLSGNFGNGVVLDVSGAQLDPGTYSVAVSNSVTGCVTTFGTIVANPRTFSWTPSPPGSPVPQIVCEGPSYDCYGDFSFPAGFTPDEVQTVSILNSRGDTVLTSAPSNHANVFRKSLLWAPSSPFRSEYEAAVVERENGFTLDVTTIGLDVGVYSVIATNSADGSAVEFGSFFVTLVPYPPILVEQVSGGSFKFPSSFPPTNVDRVYIVDFTGASVLSTDSSVALGNPVDSSHLVFALQPTAAAAAVDSGSASIETVYSLSGASDSSGPTACLTINTVGLTGPSYTASVTSLSTGDTTVLGVFAPAQLVYDFSTPPAGAALVLFPPGFDTTDVASVQISDPDNTVILTGSGVVSSGGAPIGIVTAPIGSGPAPIGAVPVPIDGGTAPSGGGSGSEWVHEKISLQSVSSASSGAVGRATLIIDDKGGISSAALMVKASGLEAGNYLVAVTSISDGSGTFLGTLDVAAHKSRSKVVSARFGDGGATFPTGFNPTDVASIQITDSSGTALLAGSAGARSSAAITNFSTKAPVTPGEGAPNAKGRAGLSGRMIEQKLHQALAVAAKGVPKSEHLTILIDGQAAGVVKTSRAGVVSLALTLKGQSSKISSIALQTADGTIVLSANF